jgi:opacity protein-like surface antigen
MRSRSIHISVALAGLGLAAPLAAKEDIEPQFDVTPMIGYRGGGDFDALAGTDNPNIEPEASFGIAFGWRTDAQTRYELLYDAQLTQIQDLGVDLDVEHLHVGGTASFGDGDTVKPYIAGGIGATRLRPSSGDDETRFSMSIALGVDIPISERIGVRLETRGYLVSMSSNSEIFCQSGSSGGSCLVRAASDAMFQYSVLGGVALKF